MISSLMLETRWEVKHGGEIYSRDVNWRLLLRIKTEPASSHILYGSAVNTSYLHILTCCRSQRHHSVFNINLQRLSGCLIIVLALRAACLRLLGHVNAWLSRISQIISSQLAASSACFYSHRRTESVTAQNKLLMMSHTITAPHPAVTRCDL